MVYRHVARKHAPASTHAGWARHTPIDTCPCKKLYATALRYDRNRCTRCRKLRLYVHIILFIEDGAFQMTAQELSTIPRRDSEAEGHLLQDSDQGRIGGRLADSAPNFAQRCAELNLPRLATLLGPSPEVSSAVFLEAWYDRNAYLNHAFPRRSLGCWTTASICYGFETSRKRLDSAARRYIDASPTGLFRSRAAWGRIRSVGCSPKLMPGSDLCRRRNAERRPTT